MASGVAALGLACTLAPFGIIGGLSVNKTLKYRPQHWISWVLVMVGTGLLLTLRVDTPEAHLIGFEVIFAAGLGALSTVTYFPVLAPIPVTANAQALAFYSFLRTFAQVSQNDQSVYRMKSLKAETYVFPALKGLGRHHRWYNPPESAP